MNFAYTKKVFSSGLKVVFRQMNSPLLAFNLWTRVGVKDEEPSMDQGAILYCLRL